MKGRIAFTCLSTTTLRPDLPATLICLLRPVPSWYLRARAIPSTDQMSGRLLSLTSIETASPSSDSTSPLTNARISLRPSTSRGTVLPSNPSRSFRENCTLGILAHRLVPNPVKVRSEQLANILNLTVHHVEPVNPETPRQDRDLDAQRLRYLWTEYSTATKLHPANTLPVRLQLNTRLREREIVRLEPDPIRPRNLPGKHLQYSKQIPQVQTRIKNNALCLVELCQMSLVKHVWTKAARYSEVFSWNLEIFRDHTPNDELCPVDSKNQFRRFFNGKLVSPSCRACLPAVLVSLRNPLHEIPILFETRSRRVLQIVEIMNLPCRMILRHVETVAVDESSLDERSNGFSKTQSDKLPLHHSQESQVGMILAGEGLRNWRGDVVASKLDPLPLARADHLAGKQAYLLLCAGPGYGISPVRCYLDLSQVPDSSL